MERQIESLLEGVRACRVLAVRAADGAVRGLVAFVYRSSEVITPPPRAATTGTPVAMASMIVRPNGSGLHHEWTSTVIRADRADIHAVAGEDHLAGNTFASDERVELAPVLSGESRRYGPPTTMNRSRGCCRSSGAAARIAPPSMPFHRIEAGDDDADDRRARGQAVFGIHQRPEVDALAHLERQVDSVWRDGDSPRPPRPRTLLGGRIRGVDEDRVAAQERRRAIHPRTDRPVLYKTARTPVRAAVAPPIRCV